MLGMSLAYYNVSLAGVINLQYYNIWRKSIYRKKGTTIWLLNLLFGDSNKSTSSKALAVDITTIYSFIESGLIVHRLSLY